MLKYFKRTFKKIFLSREEKFFRDLFKMCSDNESSIAKNILMAYTWPKLMNARLKKTLSNSLIVNPTDAIKIKKFIKRWPVTKIPITILDNPLYDDTIYTRLNSHDIADNLYSNLLTGELVLFRSPSLDGYDLVMDLKGSNLPAIGWVGFNRIITSRYYSNEFTLTKDRYDKLTNPDSMVFASDSNLGLIIEPDQTVIVFDKLFRKHKITFK